MILNSLIIPRIHGKFLHKFTAKKVFSTCFVCSASSLAISMGGTVTSRDTTHKVVTHDKELDSHTVRYSEQVEWGFWTCDAYSKTFSTSAHCRYKILAGDQQLTKTTYTIKNIVCEESFQDFDNCSYSTGTRGVKTYTLMLFCHPRPGKFKMSMSLQYWW